MKVFPVIFSQCVWLLICWTWTVGVAQQANDNIYLLEGYPSYSVVLPINVDNHPSEQSFVVKSPRFHRVMAVVQYINLPPKNDFSCGGYLQFQDGADKRSEKICGNFDPDEKAFDPPSLVGSRSYLSSRETLKVNFINYPRAKFESSYARIAFTAFRDDCYFMQPKNWTGGLPRYRPCEYSMNEDGIGRQCIVSSLFCDQVIHCAETDDKGTDFGQDESQMNCPHIYHMKEAYTSIIIPDKETSTIVNSSSSAAASEGEGVEFKSTNFNSFFEHREEHLANLFKSAIIGFVGICTVCILAAFVVTMFCLKQNVYRIQNDNSNNF